MADDQNNLGQNNSTKEVYRDPVGNLDMVQPSTTGESLSNNPFLRGPATNVAYPNKNSTVSEQYAYSGNVPVLQTSTEPISLTATQPTSGDVASRIENIKAFLRTQANIPSQGLAELFSTAASATPEDQTPFIEPVSYNPTTYFGHVQQRSERLLKKAA